MKTRIWYSHFVIISLALGLLVSAIIFLHINFKFQESLAIASTNTNGTTMLSSSLNDKANTTAHSPPQGGEIIPGEFIVILKEKAANNNLINNNNSVKDLINKIERLGFNITSDYRDIRLISIKANNQTMDAGPKAIESAVDQIRSDPRVESVEPNRIAVAAGID